ncbi:MAG: hypothetical protein EZS28_043966, partial [Streblomastix strix]
GWNVYLYLNLSTMEDLFCWNARIEENRLIKVSLQTPKAILIIDVPYDV